MIRSLLALVVILVGAQAAADTYVCTDEEGDTTLTNIPCSRGSITQKHNRSGKTHPQNSRKIIGYSYRFEDREGRTLFTNRRKAGKGMKMVSRRPIYYYGKPRSGGPAPVLKVLRERVKMYKPLILQAARDTGLDANLIHAVILAESAYDPQARSPKGAMGLMQLMPATAKRYGVGNPYDAAQNIRGGTRYLSYLMKRFGNDIELAVAAYNAGEGAVEKYNRSVPPFKETQNYVEKVKGYMAQGMLAFN
ncbi:transglycosylase SLT domain-containing protein [Thiolapillus sp.]